MKADVTNNYVIVSYAAFTNLLRQALNPHQFDTNAFPLTITNGPPAVISLNSTQFTGVGPYTLTNAIGVAGVTNVFLIAGTNVTITTNDMGGSVSYLVASTGGGGSGGISLLTTNGSGILLYTNASLITVATDTNLFDLKGAANLASNGAIAFSLTIGTSGTNNVNAVSNILYASILSSTNSILTNANVFTKTNTFVGLNVTNLNTTNITASSIISGLVQVDNFQNAGGQIIGSVGTNFGWPLTITIPAAIQLSNSPIMTLGHIQGTISDGTNFVSAVTSYIAKLTNNFTLLSSNMTPFSGLAGGVNHLAPGYWNPLDNNYYFIAENYIACGTVSAIQVLAYDQSLARVSANLLTGAPAQDAFGEGSALVLVQADGPNGTLYTASYCTNRVFKWDALTYAYLGYIQLDLPVINAQGLTYTNGIFYLVSDQPGVGTFYTFDHTGHVLSGYPYQLAGGLGSATAEGITFFKGQVAQSYELVSGSVLIFATLQTNILTVVDGLGNLTNSGAFVNLSSSWLDGNLNVSNRTSLGSFSKAIATNANLAIYGGGSSRTHIKLINPDAALTYDMGLNLASRNGTIGVNLNGDNTQQNSSLDGFRFQFDPGSGGGGNGSFTILTKTGGTLFTAIQSDAAGDITIPHQTSISSGNTAFRALIIDTPSGPNADVIDIQTNGVKVISVDKRGNLYVSNNIFAFNLYITNLTVTNGFVLLTNSFSTNYGGHSFWTNPANGSWAMIGTNGGIVSTNGTAASQLYIFTNGAGFLQKGFTSTGATNNALTATAFMLTDANKGQSSVAQSGLSTDYLGGDGALHALPAGGTSPTNTFNAQQFTLVNGTNVNWAITTVATNLVLTNGYLQLTNGSITNYSGRYFGTNPVTASYAIIYTNGGFAYTNGTAASQYTEFTNGAGFLQQGFTSTGATNTSLTASKIVLTDVNKGQKSSTFADTDLMPNSLTNGLAQGITNAGNIAFLPSVNVFTTSNLFSAPALINSLTPIASFSNSSPATVGVQQWGGIYIGGNTWNTTATAQSTNSGWFVTSEGIQGTSATIADSLVFSSAIGLNSPNTRLTLTSVGALTTAGSSANLTIGGSATVNGSITSTTGNITSTAGDVIISTAGKGLQIKGGSNAKIGTSVLVGGTVTVSTTAITANSVVFLTVQVTGGTTGNLSIGTVTAGTSFIINSTSAIDTSTVGWIIIEKN